jgi:hypothetical protein
MQGHLREIEGRSLPQLLDEFAQLRTTNLFVPTSRSAAYTPNSAASP